MLHKHPLFHRVEGLHLRKGLRAIALLYGEEDLDKPRKS
jgi:hypothetical protein